MLLIKKICESDLHSVCDAKCSKFGCLSAFLSDSLISQPIRTTDTKCHSCSSIAPVVNGSLWTPPHGCSSGGVRSRRHLESLSYSPSRPLKRFRWILWACQETLTRPGVTSKFNQCQWTFSRCVGPKGMGCVGPWKLFRGQESFLTRWSDYIIRYCV